MISGRESGQASRAAQPDWIAPINSQNLCQIILKMTGVDIVRHRLVSTRRVFRLDRLIPFSAKT